jgi:ferritin-like metal-binding protein YciE
MKTETLQDLYFKELHDLYGSEKLLVKSLPQFMDSAELPELRQALAHHLAETRGQVTRLEQILQIHGEKPAVKKSKALEGILREGEEDAADAASGSVRDAAIVAAMQQVEHYEIAAYGSLQTYAIHLGFGDAGKLLQTTLDEERAADQKLTQLALQYTKVEVTRTA